MSINKNRITGAAKQAAGATKEAVGHLVGDTDLEVSGKIEKTEGKLQSAAGKAMDNLKDLAKS